MEPIAPLWQRAAEFGLLAFLLVLVLTAVGFAAWKIGNRVADVLATTLTRQASAADRTADAVEKISTMTAVMASQAEAWDEKLAHLQRWSQRHTRVTKIMVDAMQEVVPIDKSKAHLLMQSARQQLDADE